MPTTRRPSRPRLLAAVALVVAAALVAAGCSSSSSSGTPAPTTTAKPATTTTASGLPLATSGAGAPHVAAVGTYAVGAHTVTWVDTTRGTNANGSAPARPTRTFKTLVLYPAAGVGTPKPTVDAPAAKGPWPLVLFSHGVTAKGSDYTLTLQLLVSAGYVVVAPDYPLSNRDAPGGPTIVDEPTQAKGDVPFLLDQALAANRASGFLHGLVDPGRIGLAGHSLGAVTSITAGYDPCCAQARVKAVAEWSGVLVPLTQPFHVASVATHRPLLIIHGEADGTVPYASAGKLYAAVGAPKVEVSLPGQGHIPAFVIGDGSPAAKVVVASTVAFFDAELKGDPTALATIDATVTAAGPKVATLREDLG